jgi:hypothetical protein
VMLLEEIVEVRVKIDGSEIRSLVFKEECDLSARVLNPLDYCGYLDDEMHLSFGGNPFFYKHSQEPGDILKVIVSLRLGGSARVNARIDARTHTRPIMGGLNPRNQPCALLLPFVKLM